MATINKKLVHFNKLSDFELRLEAGDILSHSIVFIKDANMIWTHGEYYSDTRDVLRIAEQELSESEQAQVKANLGIKKEVAIGEAVPLELPDLFIDTSRDYGDVQSDAVEEAPADGKQYARKDAAWTEVEPGEPFVNAEYGKIIKEANESQSITQDNYNLLLNAVTSSPDGIMFCEYEHIYGRLYFMVMNADSGDIVVYVNSQMSHVPEPSFLSSVLIISSDLTATINKDSVITLSTSGDGTKFLSNSGEYKTVGQFANQEYADIVVNAIGSNAISSDDYNKLSAWSVPVDDVYPYAETLFQGAVARMTIANTDEGVYAYIHMTQTATDSPLYTIFYLVEIKTDLTVTIKEQNQIGLIASEDGTKFLANDGQYKEIEPGISDAPKDRNLYGRILGGWGVIKQDTLDTYDVSSDGQIFNFTKNLEKGIVQYAEIYNPLETEVTIYIKRDTDTRQVEVKIDPGSTVLFRIISGIKGFYLEKVYYSYL